MINLNAIITKTDYAITYTSLNDLIDQLAVILDKPTATFNYSTTNYYGIDLGSGCCLYVIGTFLVGSTFTSANVVQYGNNAIYISSGLTASGTIYLSCYKSDKMIAFTGNYDTCIFVNYHVSTGLWGSIISNSRLSVNGVQNTMANITIKDDIRNVYLMPYSLNGLMLDNLYAISQPAQLSTTMPIWFELEGIGMGMKQNMVWCL